MGLRGVVGRGCALYEGMMVYFCNTYEANTTDGAV